MTARHKLEVCVSNVELGSQEVCDRLAAAYPDVRVRRWGCLGMCHRCVHHPCVLLDDHEFLEAENADALWELVQAYLAK